MKQLTTVLYVYLLLCLLEITGNFLENDYLIFATKPLLMPVLLVWFWLASKAYPSKFRNIIAGSIVCGFFGDTFLLFVPQNEIFFLLGLGSFLIGQLLYGWGFILNIKNSSGTGNPKLNMLFAILFGAFYFMLMNELYPLLGEFLIPVLIYGLAICFMGLTAAFRFNKVLTSSYYYVLAGAMVFVVSDTLIALDKFYVEGGIPFGQAYIMITYCTAQYLITKGALIHLDSKK